MEPAETAALTSSDSVLPPGGGKWVIGAGLELGYLGPLATNGRFQRAIGRSCGGIVALEAPVGRRLVPSARSAPRCAVKS